MPVTFFPYRHLFLLSKSEPNSDTFDMSSSLGSLKAGELPEGGGLGALAGGGADGFTGRQLGCV
jgi:hypothetical protein